MTKFETAMREKILGIIANLDAGTVGISRENLWQLIVPGLCRLPGAPTGANAPYVARALFDALVMTTPFTRFVYA